MVPRKARTARCGMLRSWFCACFWEWAINRPRQAATRGQRDRNGQANHSRARAARARAAHVPGRVCVHPHPRGACRPERLCGRVGVDGADREPDRWAAGGPVCARGRDRPPSIELYGGTEDYLVTREFAARATDEQKRATVAACFAVAAADHLITAEEYTELSQIADELDLSRADLNVIRREYVDQLAAIQQMRGERG